MRVDTNEDRTGSTASSEPSTSGGNHVQFIQLEQVKLPGELKRSCGKSKHVSRVQPRANLDKVRTIHVAEAM